MASISTSENHLNWFENTTYSSSLGINDIIGEEIKIYPNPTSNYLNFSIKNPSDYQINVFDVLGKKVLETNIDSVNSRLDVSNLNRGVYILTFKNYNGSYKFIKR